LLKSIIENFPEAIDLDMDRRAAARLAIHFARKMAGEEYQSMFWTTDVDEHDCRIALDPRFPR
jgi:hypothetical protein